MAPDVKLRYGFRTDTGKLRAHNEDSLLPLPASGVFAVADGVGGQKSGEIASRKAMVGVETWIKAHPLAEGDGLDGTDRSRWLRTYFTACLRGINNDILLLASADPACANMATTAVLACFEEDTLRLVNIGDSRAYLFRGGFIRQLTEDHTYVNELVRAGTLTKAEARDHPKKNIITKALGALAEAEPDFFSLPAEEGDRVLLCTDGLSGELTDAEIARILAAESDPQACADALVSAANEMGGRDNITVIVIDRKE